MLKFTLAPDVTATEGKPLRALDVDVLDPAVDVLVAVADTLPVKGYVVGIRVGTER